MPPLNPLRAFEAAARHESFTKAAEELNVTQGAISHHVRTLEEYLGFNLVERVNNNLMIPPETQRFADALTQAFDQIHRAAKDLTQSRRRTILVVRAYTNFVLRWLIPRLPAFQKLHPEIEIRISAGRVDVDFETDDVDVAVRWGLPRWSDVHHELLFHDEMIPVCSPDLARSLHIQRPEDLLRATLYHSYQRRDEWPRWFEAATGTKHMPLRHMYLEEQAIVHQCLLAGMGVGLAQRHYVTDDVRDGKLVVPFDIAIRNPEGFYFVCPPDHLARTTIGIFREWLLANAHEGLQPGP